MNHLLKIFMVAVALVTAIPSFAVTDKEMEQARAIAAKHYLRYANNGSDYLDKLSPSSIGELSKSLKAKEQENLKSFNSVATPKDYASWDKKKLVEYWSKTFFNSPGLKEDGKKCLSILAKNLNKMTVADPSAAAKPAEQTVETKVTETPVADAKAPAATAAGNSTALAQSAQTQTAATDGENQAEQPTETVEAAVAQAEADAGLADDQPRKQSNTGWYVAILIVLVGVVIWLVMYASKSMKETGATLADHQTGEKEIREAKRAAKEEQNKMREQYANSLTSKNEEIKQLKTRNSALENELAAVQRNLEAARLELDGVKRELSALRQRPQTTKDHDSPKQPASARSGALPPVVFLGSVNQKGLFTKASRSLNAELSVYRMDIPDGHHGKFRVVSDTEVLGRLIENPERWLSGGCVIENPQDADIAVEIVTLQPGEAIFADNSCRVTKKARIKFI